MNYETFKSVLLEYVKETIPGQKTVKIEPVDKPNEGTMDALMIWVETAGATPVIYLNKLYEAYKSGEPFARICEAVKKACEAGQGTMPETEAIKDIIKRYDTARGYIMPRLINARENAKLLESVPHDEFLDLAVIYEVVLPAGEGTMNVRVTDETAKMWGVTKDDLAAAAQENSTPVLTDINMMFIKAFSEVKKQENLLDETGPINLNDHGPGAPMFVLMNTKNDRGAAVMTYKGLLEGIARRFGCSMYILPSSIHEVILVPTGGDEADMSTMNKMVREVNAREVPPQDVLSDHAYYFDYATGKITYDACA